MKSTLKRLREIKAAWRQGETRLQRAAAVDPLFNIKLGLLGVFAVILLFYSLSLFTNVFRNDSPIAAMQRLLNTADVAFTEKRYEKTAKAAAAANALAPVVKNPQMTQQGLLLAGKALYLLHREEEGMTYFQQAIALSEEQGDNTALFAASAYQAVAEVYRTQAQFDKAMAATEQMAVYYRRAKKAVAAAPVYISLADAMFLAGNQSFPTIIALYDKAATLYTNQKDFFALALVRERMGAASVKPAKKQAIEYYLEAYHLYERLRNKERTEAARASLEAIDPYALSSIYD